MLVGRGIARILRGELAAARSDLDEAEGVLSRAQTFRGVDEVIAALIVATGLGAGKRGEAEELWRYVDLHRSTIFLTSASSTVDSQANTLHTRWLRTLTPKRTSSTRAPQDSMYHREPWCLLRNLPGLKAGQLYFVIQRRAT